MNFNYVQSKKNLIRFLRLIFYISIPFYSESILAQKLDIQYKFRDNNRWEGVKPTVQEDVSGTLELTSLMYYPEGWEQHKTKIPNNSISIYFYSPVSKDIMVTVFNLDKRYVMEPHPKNFNKPNWNSFAWPARILNILELPLNKLEGIATTKNKQIYFPIYFILQKKLMKTNLF